MRQTIVAALLTLAASAATPAPIAHHGKDWVMLTEKPCPAAIAAKAPEQVRESLQAAVVAVSDKQWDACWLLDDQRWITFLFYEDGDQGAVSAFDFHDEPSI
jgi:hypothetical protein